ncbi:acetyltransferase [Haemophilus paracuniculus]|uniref:Acetyltransferase n=1 Tax=Haemophilus paracuniculus TaxID=734 RepID=A0A1T0ARS8_9PAST|nr:ACT domain-containing protein [Haemophilus paracuniculus]OOR98984.1 acetyltransferase [Haemophilus paracuniculus]
MTTPISDLQTLIRSMQPVLNEGIYYFATLAEGQNVPFDQIISLIQEKEGVSIVVSEQTAQQYQLDGQFKSAWITLNVHSDLAAVGLTAAFATALGKANISCNVIAGNHHDHIFVPYHLADKAMETLLNLQQS